MNQRMNIIPQPNLYVAPREGTRPRNDRTTRLAECGHHVLLSPRGIDAIDRRGKHLLCGECATALAEEQGGTLAVADFPTP